MTQLNQANMTQKIILFLCLIISLNGFTQTSDYLIKPSASFRIYYDKEQNVVNGQDGNYMYYVDVQTDKNGDVVGLVNFKHKSGVTFSQERWVRISKTHHDKNVINEVKLFDPQTGFISSHMIANNPENLPYEEISKNLNGYVYEFENTNLKALRTLYNGQTISEVLYNGNGIQKFATVKTFESNYYWETVLFDNNGQSYKIINDDLEKQDWVNWNKGFDVTGSYRDNSFWITGTRESGASIFKELPINTQKDYSVNLHLKRISGNDFSGVIFGAQSGGVQNFWHFSIAANGFYQIVKSFNGVLMPLKLSQGRLNDLPAEYRSREVYDIISNNIPIGFSKEINTGNAATNTLDVKRIGQSLIFSINGKIVEKIDNTEVFGTGTGFIVTKNSPGSNETNTVAFSDFVLTEYSPDIPEWLKINPSNSSKMTATGTGFAVSQNGIICTNYHVIQGAKKINVYINGTKATANVLVADEKRDLALLKLTKDNLITKQIPYKFDNYFPSLGENVFVLGFPSSNILGQSIKLTNGIVSSNRGFKDDNMTFQISAPIQPGNSGSPLFDDKGNLIGIINSGVPSMDNVGYAIKMQNLLALMKKIPVSPVLQTKMVSSEQLSLKAKRIVDFIYLIEVEL